MPLTRELLLDSLRNIVDPELNKDVVSLDMIKKAEVTGDTARVTVQLHNLASPLRQSIRQQIDEAARRAGAAVVEVEILGAAVAAPGRPAGAPGGPPATSALPHVRHVVAVGAGKGGVGKSTIALNLAVGLARQGLRVGLMDGDIYGPSMPTLLGVKGQQPTVDGGKIVPFFVHGIHAITIGSLVEQEKPLIWRGPMAHGAFKQLLLDNTIWPALDYLVVDLPPGTGDVPLTLCQLLPLSGAVVVATPQQVALDDAVRAVRMFQQLGAPILGLVENMSYLNGPGGVEIDLFGKGGTEKAAAAMGLPFLGALAMYPELRINSDKGTPHGNFAVDSASRPQLEALVEKLITAVSSKRAAPTLSIS